MREKISFIKTSIKELFSLYPWIKMALVSILSILGGSGFIVFLNKYAIYNYSISYGARLPIESVPYLDIAVSVLSFAFLAISFISALIIYGLLTYIASLLHRRFKNLSQKMIKLLSGLLTSFLGALISIVIELIRNFDKFTLPFNFSEFFLVIIVGLILSGLIIWKEFIRLFALVFSILLILFVAVKVFDASKYASFLREIKYGGGVPVTLLLDDKKEYKGYLFLITKTKNILWIKDNNIYLELPSKNIKETRFHDEKYLIGNINGSLVSLFNHLWN